jgi:hypothetical protein
MTIQGSQNMVSKHRWFICKIIQETLFIYIYKCIYIMTLFKIAVLPVGKEIQGFLPFDKVATRFVTCCYSTNIQ